MEEVEIRILVRRVIILVTSTTRHMPGACKIGVVARRGNSTQVDAARAVDDYLVLLGEAPRNFVESVEDDVSDDDVSEPKTSPF